MLDRFWDPEQRFKGALLKVYDHWVLELSWRQHTPGSFIIFCRRPGVRLMSQLESIEIVQLMHVQREIEDALRACEALCPDHFNYWQMGNALPHLHLHGIPRYEFPRDITRDLLRRDQTDPSWGDLPPWIRSHATPEQIRALKLLIRQHLPNPFLD